MSCAPPPSVIPASQTQTMNNSLSRPPIAIVSPPFSSICRFKIPLRVKNPTPKPYPNRFRISTTHFALSGVSTFPPHISAQFGGKRRSRRRRNHLREKILENQLVSSGNFVDSGDENFEVRESVNGGNLGNEALGCLAEEERLKLVKDSVLLSKLESWAEKYKKDVELWGVGSNPIFTVFEDVGGNVERVLVDEDEIRTRGGLEEDLKEVNLRILHARLLAKDLESGRSVIVRNSTVAKFMLGEEKGVKNAEVKELNDVKEWHKEIDEVREESSGFVSVVRSIVLQPGLYLKLSKFGIIALGGMLVLWIVKSAIGAGIRGRSMTLEKGKTEEEPKLEKAETGKVSVEVVDVSSQVQKVNIRRPKLDKQELLKKMSKNKAATIGNLQSNQSLSSQGTDSTENGKLEETFLEVGDIVTHSMEIEAGSTTLLDKNEKLLSGDGNSKMVDLPDIQDGIFRKAEADFGGESASLNNPENENKTDSVDYDSTQTCNSSADVVCDESKTTTENDSRTKEPNELAPVQDEESCAVESLVGDGADQNASKSSVVKPVPKQSASRKKIRIIKSVKEARDYLSRKRENQVPLDDYDKGFSSSVPQSEIPKKGTDFDGAIHSDIDLPQNNSALPAMISPTAMMKYSQANKKTDHNANDDIGLNESSVVSQKHHDYEQSSLTDTENQHHHRDDESIFKQSTLVPRSRSDTDTDTDKVCSRTGDVDNHTDSSIDNVAPVFGDSDYTEGKESQPIGNGCPDSISDFGKMQQSVILQGDAFSDLQLEDDGPDGSIVRQGSTPTHISDANTTQEIEEYEPAKDIDHKHASTSGVDTPIENTATSETNQTTKPNSVTEPPGHSDSWLEKNFHVLEPVVAKIRDGFRENYMVAQEKTEEVGTISDLSELKSIVDDNELDWMKDDHLRDIVFKVRDNELSGREPFHMMSNEDKDAFFGGLQKKVELENLKLLKVHEYIHSNVENLNYGADGISIYDPPEKVIPRWKGPPIEKAPDFLNKSVKQKEAMVKGDVRSPLSEKSGATSPLRVENGAPKKPKTVIEGSDGSVKPGKKNGKEFWQHTKKWSQGFLELYNAETDPEMKATMKDIGKDLDRWITEKEIQEAAELIEKMPERNKQFIQKKVEKIKREMELFGPQAVVSKYREYSEEKEEDYLWWLDLPYVLCIEMYTNEGEEQRVGFYSLEMATDLELEPKPCHVIAFEDSKDCKNMCYIIQTHLEMLSNGLAFVVARPPKDTFRESKANGFNVTVIRKGELALNIDQMLEEVEEQIVEIGSKMYHDQIMKDRSVDMNALVKGVIGDTKPIKRKRGRRKLKKSPTNIQ